jgi:hypothetical protein
MEDATYTEAEVRLLLARAEAIAIEALRAVEAMYAAAMKAEKKESE